MSLSKIVDEWGIATCKPLQPAYLIQIVQSPHRSQTSMVAPSFRLDACLPFNKCGA